MLKLIIILKRGTASECFSLQVVLVLFHVVINQISFICLLFAMEKSRDSHWKTFDIFEKCGRMSAKRQVFPLKLCFCTLSASPLAAASPRAITNAYYIYSLIFCQPADCMRLFQ